MAANRQFKALIKDKSVDLLNNFRNLFTIP